MGLGPDHPLGKLAAEFNQSLLDALDVLGLLEREGVLPPADVDMLLTKEAKRRQCEEVAVRTLLAQRRTQGHWPACTVPASPVGSAATPPTP